MPRGSLGVRDLAVALGPIALVAVLHAAGRAESVAIVQTGGAAFWPTLARFGWPLVLLALGGRRGGAGPLGPGDGSLPRRDCAAGAGALRRGARQRRGLALHGAQDAASRHLPDGRACADWRSRERGDCSSASSRRPFRPNGCRAGWASGLAWLLVVGCVAWTAARFMSVPRPEPAITEDMYRAGRWARDHTPPDCIEYLVPQDSTSVLAAPGGAPQPDAAGARIGAARLRVSRRAGALDHRHELSRGDRRSIAGSEGSAGGPGRAGPVRAHRGGEAAGDDRLVLGAEPIAGIDVTHGNLHDGREAHEARRRITLPAFLRGRRGLRRSS